MMNQYLPSAIESVKNINKQTEWKYDAKIISE